MKKLHHLSVRNIADANVFAHISSYDDLTSNIITYGEADRTDYDTRVGEALEVFAEFFFQRYGHASNPEMGVLEATHTSTNKYQTGYDFSYVDFYNLKGHIQVKFRRNPEHKFTRDDLGTFVSMADEEGVTRDRRILFTNQHHDKDGVPKSVFHMSYTGGVKQMRVFDRSYQERFIDRDPTFWADLASTVAESGKAPTEFLPLPPPYAHQARMEKACDNHIASGGNRGRVLCATGGGKTYVMFRLVKKTLTTTNLCVMVAPTIDLLRQHHAYFEQFGTFHNCGVSVVHFRTGDEARQDDYIDYVQTTTEEGLDHILDDQAAKKTIVFVTYASEQKFFDILCKHSVVADLCVWDEFHHTVRQESAYRDHLLSLPVKHNLFFSASQKRGRVVSSLDEDVYGPLLENVTYAELRENGILVPEIIIKPLRISTSGTRLDAIARDLKKVTKRENFNLRDATIEAAATIVVRADMLSSHKTSNIITFSKGVPICKALVDSTTVGSEMIGASLQTVHSEIPARDRKKVYDVIKNSVDSILFQYSVVKEGIDITPFNALIISRNLDEIGTQQGIGRVVRADPEDTAALKAGKISLDSPEGWKKYNATVYVIIHDGEMDDYRKRLKDFIGKLQFTGLTEDDYQFGEIVEERNGMLEDNDASVPILSTRELFEQESLRDMVARLRIEMEEDELLAAAELKVSKMSDEQILENCLTF